MEKEQEMIQKPCPDCGQEMDGGNMGAGVKLFYCPTCEIVKYFIGGIWVRPFEKLKIAPKGAKNIIKE